VPWPQHLKGCTLTSTASTAPQLSLLHAPCPCSTVKRCTVTGTA
jgi:hypothetical protein